MHEFGTTIIIQMIICTRKKTHCILHISLLNSFHSLYLKKLYTGYEFITDDFKHINRLSTIRTSEVEKDFK